jgi:hypothetical protein
VNARQKAKKYKKELDFYKNMPIPIVEYNRDVKTFVAKRTVATRQLHEMLFNEVDVLTHIKKEIIHDLVEAISNDVEFESVNGMLPGNTDIIGRISIVTRRE